MEKADVTQALKGADLVLVAVIFGFGLIVSRLDRLELKAPLVPESLDPLAFLKEDVVDGVAPVIAVVFEIVLVCVTF